MTKEQAVKFGQSGVYEDMPIRDAVELALSQDFLCVPFKWLHEHIEKVLDRPVYPHEFGSRGNLLSELLGETDPKTIDEILAMIPEQKRIIVGIE